MRRLWVSSMTKAAIGDGFEHLRDGEEMRNLEAAARSRSEADWLVGMNATRAATVRGRALGGVVSLGRVQTPTLALIVRRDLEIDAFEPETYFQVDARFGARRRRGPTPAAGSRARTTAPPSASGPTRSRPPPPAPAGDGRVGQAHRAQDPAAASVRPDDPAARRQQPLRALGLAHAAGGPAAVRGLGGRRASSPTRAPARSSCPPTRSAELKGIARSLTGLPGARARRPSTSPASTCCRWRGSSTTPRSTTTTRSSPPASCPTKELSGDDARVFDLVVRRFLAVFHPEAKFEDTEIITDGRRAPLPHPRPAPGRGRLARRRLRRGGRRRGAAAGRRGRAPPGAARRSTRASAAPASRPRCSRSRPSRRRATPRRRSCATWRRPASRSRTRSCARR